MTGREKFEREFPLPERCEWSDALSQYCWVYTSAAHPHENFWDVWQAAIAQSPQIPEGMALVPVDDLDAIAEVVRGMLHTAYQNAMPVCCGKPGQQCCGNPYPEWSAEDMEVMDSLGPIEKRISAMLAAAKETK